MATELIAFQALADLLGLEQTEDKYPKLTLIQESVVDAFEEYTGRSFDNDTYKESLTPMSPSSMMPLKALPVASVAQVTLDGTATTDFKIRIYGIQLGAKVDNKEIVVDYVGGLETVPKQIKRAALLQTAYEFQNSDNIGASFVSNEGGTVTVPEISLLKEVRKLLATERHPLNRML